MSTVAEAKPATRTAPPAALLFELEGVALPVRPALYEAARAHLASRQVELTHAIFTRCGGPIATLATQLLERLQLGPDNGHLAQALNAALVEELNAGRLKLNLGLTRLLDAAAKRGLPAAALTGLAEDTSQSAFNASGLESRGIQLFVFSDEEKPFPRADAWLKAAKQLGKTARFCVAVIGSHVSCKSALAAGMRTVAAPDAFTSHHDFSGADLIIDSWDDVDAEELLDTLIPALR